MKMQTKLLTRLVLGTVAGISLSLLLPQPSRADDNPRQVNPLQDIDPQNSSDPFTRMNNGDNFGLLDLVRRATSNTRSWDQFSTDQNQSLDSEAAKFRARQREIIQSQPQQPSPGNSVTTPQPAQ